MSTYTTPVAKQRLGHSMEKEAATRNNLEESRVMLELARNIKIASDEKKTATEKGFFDGWF